MNSKRNMARYGGNEPSRPAPGISWNEAARFVNWLNASAGCSPAYKSTTGGANDNLALWTAGEAGYTYKTSAGKQRQMEIFFPPDHDPAKAKVPGLILFHGGGWKGGTHRQFSHACAYFARRGLLVGEPTLQSPATGEKLIPAPTEEEK